MTIGKLSLGMPCTCPITIDGVLTLRGRFTSPYLRCHGPPLLATKINMRSSTHGELHQIIYNQAFRPESDKRGKIGTRFEPEKVIIGVVIGFCVIGAMSRRYEAQIMSPMPNFGYMSQVFHNLTGTKPDKSIADSQKELDRLMGMAINQSKVPLKPELAKVQEASENYLSELKIVDKLIDEGKYEEAETKCLALKKNFLISDADSSIALREFIALIGQARTYLEEYVNETKSLQRLRKEHKQINHFIDNLTSVVTDEFHKIMRPDLENSTKIKCKIDAFLKDLEKTKIEGKDAFSKFIKTMRSAHEKWKECVEKMEDAASEPDDN